MKALISNKYQSIELNVKYIQEEIAIRIKSAKNELEVLHEKFKNKLDQIKVDIMKYFYAEDRNIFNSLLMIFKIK